MSSSDSSSYCVVCGHGEDGPVIECGKCQEKRHAKCVQVDEAHAKHITKYECEKCSDDGMEIFEYNMRNIVASSSRKLRSGRGKSATARGSQNLKAKLIGRTPKSIGKPTPKQPGRAFVHKGYRYCIEKKGAKLALWHCSRWDAGCEVRLFRDMESGAVKRVTNEHNHPPMESTAAENESASAKWASPTADSSMSSNPAAEPRKSSLARQAFRHKGYAYHREHQSKDGTKQFWTCKDLKRMQCTARLHTSVANGEVIAELGEHDHPPLVTAKTEVDATSTKNANDSPAASTQDSTSSRPADKSPFAQSSLRHEGYDYWHHSLSKTGAKRYWFCKQKRNIRCPARMDTSARGDVLQVVGQHSHPPIKSESNDQPTENSPEGLPSSLKLKSAASSSKSATNSSPSKSRLRHKGFLYHRDQLSRDGTRRYWYCSLKSKLRCVARLHTSLDSGEVVQLVGKHVHKPVDHAAKKDVKCEQEDTPKTGGGTMRRRTLGADSQHAAHLAPKKLRASVSVETKNNNSTPVVASAPTGANTAPSVVTVVQRLMALEPAKRASATLLFNSLLDDMEADGR